MIKVTNVTKRFGNFKALDGLDMNVGRGQIYGLVGPNGAGKSTIIRHLTGAFKQDAGEILIDGQPVYDNVKAKRKIGYIPDDVFYFNQSNMLDMKAYYKAVYPNFDEKLFDQLKECF
ncbi:MAG: ATP-binding cassette domain-containing protein, partial [Lachnospiraceae bacterium]|nr:ATP-binding cassette domain-containing protein [Lachnospiraceae bacterium]